MQSFRNKVLEVVKKIPRGSILTYKQVADRAGNKNAARAVGTFMKNNYDPTIPCHRIIRSDGKLGDYNRGGTAVKRKLLKKEGFIK